MWKMPLLTDSKIFTATKTTWDIDFYNLFCGKLVKLTLHTLIYSAVPSKTENCSGINSVDAVLSDFANTLDFEL